MNCPNCNADSSRQRILPEGKRQCSTCATIWSLNENGAYIIKQGQDFLAEVVPSQTALL